MTDDEIIEVVRAHKEGKKIEAKSIGLSPTYGWHYIGDPNWNFEKLIYRVAPEPRKPREWWLDFKHVETQAEVHRYNYCGDCVHVREVIE